MEDVSGKRLAQLAAGKKTIAQDNATPQGFKGKKNIYVCEKCKGHIVTVDVDEGTSPFSISCHATALCDGWMKSSMYRVFDQDMRAGFEWYRPTAVDVVAPHLQSHVAQGGLLFRKASS